MVTKSKPTLISLTALAVVFNATLVSADTTSMTTTAATEADVHLSNIIPDNGAADRIGAADRLRTLSQEISAETCFLHNDVMSDHNRSALAHSVSEFDEILDALLYGDPDRHIIGAEENPKTIREIEAIKAEWEPVHLAADATLANPDDAAAVHQIYEQSEHLLETTSHLLSELESEYSHPTEVLMADMLLIEFAGRQAMLTQKIAYDACLVWSGYGGQEQMDELHEICGNFDLIARALHDGLDAVGIAKAPTPQIREALEEVVADWDEVLSHLEHVADGGQVGHDNMSWIDMAMTKKMHRMEEIVEMYVVYSRRALI